MELAISFSPSYVVLLIFCTSKTSLWYTSVVVLDRLQIANYLIYHIRY